jgi:hypothetical protein
VIPKVAEVFRKRELVLIHADQLQIFSMNAVAVEETKQQQQQKEEEDTANMIMNSAKTRFRKGKALEPKVFLATREFYDTDTFKAFKAQTSIQLVNSFGKMVSNLRLVFLLLTLFSCIRKSSSTRKLKISRS